MDGLLIDSEDIYTLITNTVLAEYGRPPLPWNIKAQLQGRPGPAAGRILLDWAQLPISDEEYVAKCKTLQHEHFPNAGPLPGVLALLKHLSEAGIHMALATSSQTLNYRLKTTHLSHLFDCFPPSQRILGDDPRIAQGRGKPAPDIYQLALRTVNESLKAKGERDVRPEECLVFEDSVPGVESGRRAGMRVVWCPHPGLKGELNGQEEKVLAGCTESVDHEGLRGIEEAREEEGLSGWPGKEGDGWAEMLETLEDFPYDHYGIREVKS